MAKKRAVTAHLEGISGEVLENNQVAIRSLITGKAGIYALYKNDSLYYVGLATNLTRRLRSHLKDRHKRRWNRFSVYLTVHDDYTKELESLVLRIVNPKGNWQSGKFMKATNLRGELNRAIKAEQDDERARLMGGKLAIRRVRSKSTKAKGKQVLGGVLGRRLVLKGWSKGWEYRASLRKNGTISYAGRVYDSPSAAARVALGRPANGWAFWHFRTPNSEWAPLRTLKK